MVLKHLSLEHWLTDLIAENRRIDKAGEKLIAENVEIAEAPRETEKGFC